jgi:putative addiction module killer protein
MFSIKQTKYFIDNLNKLKNIQAKVSILRRIERIKNGNFGDYKSITNNLFELRFTIGAGYRIYYTKRNNQIIILLTVGDKSSQQKDINKAKKILQELENE